MLKLRDYQQDIANKGFEILNKLGIVIKIHYICIVLSQIHKELRLIT